MFERKKLAVVAIAAMALVGVSACSSDDSDSAVDAATSSAAAAVSSATSAVESAVDSATASADSADAPSKETLQQTLTVVADPNAAPADKAAVVTDGESKTATFEAVQAVLVNYPLTFDVGDITVAGTTASAPVTVTGPHGGAPVPMTWENVDGTWKLSTASFCGLAAMGQVAC